jgi:hypothetical protein
MMPILNNHYVVRQALKTDQKKYSIQQSKMKTRLTLILTISLTFRLFSVLPESEFIKAHITSLPISVVLSFFTVSQTGNLLFS